MHQLNRRYIVILAVVASAILVVGTLLRPRQPTTDEPVPGLSQAELSRLTRLAQRRSLESMTDYFANVARDAGSGVVAIPSLSRSGLVWSPGLVLTARLEWRFPEVATLATPTGDIDVAVEAAGPHLPLAALRVSDTVGLRPPRHRPPTMLAPGVWTLAVWQGPDDLSFAPAHYLSVSATRCRDDPVDELLTNMAWSADMAGGGLFDLDGGLVAVILPCGERFAAITVASVESFLRRGQTLDGHLLRRYGLRVDRLTEQEQTYFAQPGGVVVREVWSGYPAETAGFKPGDLVVAVDADLIADPAQLEPMDTPAGATFEVAVRRGNEMIRITLSSNPAELERHTSQATDVSTGVVLPTTAAGHPIDAVVPHSAADIAGIRAGDHLLRIDGVLADDIDEVQAAFSPNRTAPVFVELERDGRRWGVLLP